MSTTPLEQQELKCWLALNRAPGLGPARARALLERFGSARASIECGETELTRIGLRSDARAYLRSNTWPGVEADLTWLRGENRHILPYNSPDYPQQLKAIARPPILLFVEGSIASLSRPQLAIVGSRNPTPTARDTAFAFSAELAAMGITITSGLAAGIDGASHRGAIQADGFTVAVMGCGLDRVYPANHRKLAEKVAEHGAIVSEFPVAEPPRAQNFPRRNRVIAGLSTGVLVVEAALRSGSLITARYATEQGREVLAMPGSIHNPLARGCHALIRQGAKLVETVTDILEEIGPLLGSSSAPVAPDPKVEDIAATLDEQHRALLDQVDYDASSVDTLVDRTGLTAQAVSSMLLHLELKGFIASIAGGLYTRSPRNLR
jgi:DNA processing protein